MRALRQRVFSNLLKPPSRLNIQVLTERRTYLLLLKRHFWASPSTVVSWGTHAGCTPEPDPGPAAARRSALSPRERVCCPGLHLSRCSVTDAGNLRAGLKRLVSAAAVFLLKNNKQMFGWEQVCFKLLLPLESAHTRSPFSVLSQVFTIPALLQPKLG